MKKFFPPGFPYRTELNLLALCLLLAALPQLFLLKKISKARALLFVGSSYIEGRRMPDFITLCKGSNAGFAALCLLAVSFLIAHYAYHRTGTKSIYTMKRLHNRSEFHMRCLIVPLIAMSLSLALSLLFLMISQKFYLSLSPQMSLNPEQTLRVLPLWRASFFFI